MVICGSNNLTEEPFKRERIFVLPFLHLLSGKTVAIGGKMAFSVWFIEPLFAELTGFEISELDVQSFGYTGENLSADA